MKYTRLDNGDIIFPRRGNPPPDIPNYVRDPGDPYLFKADFIKCKHRIVLSQVAPCGKVNTSWHCQLFGKTVSVPYCSSCKVESKE